MLGLKSNKEKLNVLKTPKSRKMELIGKVLKFKEEKSEVSEF